MSSIQFQPSLVLLDPSNGIFIISFSDCFHLEPDQEEIIFASSSCDAYIDVTLIEL
jgi:hypothetical protein